MCARRRKDVSAGVGKKLKKQKGNDNNNYYDPDS